MADVRLKKDFIDGEKLFAVQLNNNFGAIEAALGTMNKIVWQDEDADAVVTYRGTTEDLEAREIINGQLLYNTETGETFIDYQDQRISTGSGNVVHIGENAPTNPSTKLWINPNDMLHTLGSEVIDSMSGNEHTVAPSVDAVKNYVGDELIDTYSTDEVKTNKVWIDGEPIYRKVATGTIESGEGIYPHVVTGISDLDTPIKIETIIKYGDGRYYRPNLLCYLDKQSNNDIVFISPENSGTVLVIVEYTKVGE